MPPVERSPNRFDSRSFLADLRREVEQHPAVNHVFLARLACTPFTREDYRVFGLQHYPLVGMFTSYMERLLMHPVLPSSKIWLAKVLVDEYGEGSEGDDHTVLYRRFLTACAVGPEQENTELLDWRVVDFIRTHTRLVSAEPFLVGLGALGPGHEWAIPRMFVPVIEGLRRAGFSEPEISYFTLHVEQDVDHAAWLEEALEEMIRTPEDAEQVRRGAMMSLAARYRFWDGVQYRVVRWRQPVQRWDFRERTRMWLGEQNPRIARIAPRLAARTAVYRDQVRKLVRVRL